MRLLGARVELYMVLPLQKATSWVLCTTDAVLLGNSFTESLVLTLKPDLWSFY